MKPSQWKIGVSIIAMMSAGLGMSGTSFAQSSPQPTSNVQLDEVIVTARRTSESINDAPLSIGVLGKDFLADQKVESVEEVLQLSPGATFLVFSKAQPEKSLRGFVAPSTGNASAEQSIVTVIDGFSLTKDAFKSPPVFDLERVEVLRGPQGTTFGRNASIGLIHLVTAKPTFDTEAGFNLTAGTDELFEVDGYISGGVSDTLALRLAVNYDTEDGKTSDTVTGDGLDGESNFAIRGSALWEPTDRFKAHVKVEYSEDNDEADVRRAVDSTIPTIDGPRASDFAFVGAFANHPNNGLTFFDSDDPFETQQSTDRDFFFDREILTASAELSYDLTDDITITSITGYQDGEGEGLADVLGTPVNLVFQNVVNDGSIFSEEIRIDNLASSDRFRWLAGAYYLNDNESRFQQNQFYQPDLNNNGATLFPQIPSFITDEAENDTESIALFGELYYDLTDQIEVVVGGRWSRDEKDAVISATGSGFIPFLGGLQPCPRSAPVGPPLTAATPDSPCGFTNVAVSEDFSDFTGKASISYKINDSHSVYALFSQGFKSGGFQNSARTAEAAATPFNEETVDNYEIGWKGEINNRARFSLTGFFQEADGIQTVTLESVGDGFASVTSNLGSVESFGVEGDLTYQVTDNLRIGGTFAAIDAELQDTEIVLARDANGVPTNVVDLSGERPEVAPRWTGTAYAQYEHEFANGNILSLRGDFTGRDSIFDGNENRDTTVRVRPTLTNFGARIGYEFGEDNQYRVLLWGKNLNEDEDISNIGPFQPNTLQLPVGFALKREMGVTLSANFR